MENVIKIYSEYLKEKPTYKYYKISFIERILKSGKSILEFDLKADLLLSNEYFLNKFLENDISEDELEILNNKFNLNTRLSYFENYFKDFSIAKSSDNSLETTELTAYGQSTSQNRRIIAFRGRFKNGKLSSYESKIEACEPFSFIKDDKLYGKLYDKYTLGGTGFLDEIIKNGVMGLLNAQIVETLYSISMKEYNDVLNFFKNLLKKNNSFRKPFVLNGDPTNGILLHGDEYYSETVCDKLYESSESNSELENYYFSNFVISRMGVDNSLFAKTEIKGLKRVEYKTQNNLDGYGFYLNDVVKLLVDDFKKSSIFSENVKKYNYSVFEMMDFEKEKLFFKQVNSLIEKSINLADKIIEIVNEKKRKEKKNKAIGYLFIIVVIVVLILLFS
jgi:hypothetical protein